MESYNSIFISILVVLVYFFSYILVRIKKISLVHHRRFWNILLLVSFLITGILGIILAIAIDQKINLGWYRDFLWWHVEAGIVMAIISVFHAGWHARYYLSIYKKSK